MKKLFLVLFCLLTAVAIKAQAPQNLNYQAIARDASGTIVTSAIGIKFEIFSGSVGGTLVYEETNNITPSSAGIFTAAIGGGTPVSGTFSTINWGGASYFLQVSIDPSGGTSYSTVGASQLLSVPYALYAESTKPSTLSISGNSLSISNGNSITLPAGTSYTAGTGISITGNIITNTAPNATLIPAGISSITGTYPTFTIDVPAPALGYNNLSNVLTLTQGTAVTTTTLVGSGSNTVSVYASGIASVTPVGAGSNFTVSVQSPSFTGVGSTTVSGTYPNYVISTPAASTLATMTSIQINPPHTTSTLSPGNFSVNVVPTSISGPGVIGTYPNYTITGSPSTTISPGGPNVVVSGSSPLYTISVATPTLQINAPNSVTPLGLNNYSINVPQVNLAGAGVATVSGSYPTYTVGVSAPTITASGNTLTIAQGTAISTSTFSAGPWAVAGGVLYPSANPTNDKVAIGQNFANGNLDILNAAGSTNSLSPVVYVNNANSSFGANGVLQVKNSAGGGAGIFVDQNTNVGDGVSVNVNGVTNGGNALQVQHFGIGNAGYFSINNASNVARVIEANTIGTGNVIYASINNTLTTAAAIYASTNGQGAAGYFNKTGTGYGLYSSHTGSSGNAGFFNNSNATNSQQALTAQTSGSGEALAAYNIGTGRAFYANSTGSVETGMFNNSGTGRSLYAASSNTNDVAYFSNTGNGRVLYAINTGSTEVAYFVNTGTARSVMATNNSATSETGFFNNSGNGRGIVIQNPTASPTRAAFINGGLDIMGKTSGSGTFPLIVTNIGSTNLFNVRDDGNVGVGVSNPGYRLSVFDGGSSNAALYASQNSAALSPGAHGIYGLTSNSSTMAAGVMGESNGNGPGLFGLKAGGSGPAGRFEQNVSGNSADAVLVSQSGTGTGIHTKNNVAAGSSNVGVLVEEAHIGSLSAAPPTIGATGCTACNSASLQIQSNDIAGTVGYNMSGSYGASYNYVITFNKPYRKKPTVTLTAASQIATVGGYYVTIVGVSGNYTGFTITWPAGIASGAGTVLLNYIVIESSN